MLQEAPSPDEGCSAGATVAVVSGVADSGEAAETVVGVADADSVVAVGSISVGVAEAASVGVEEGGPVSVLSGEDTLSVAVGSVVASSVIPGNAPGSLGLTGAALVAHPRKSMRSRMTRRTIATINLKRS